MKKTEIANIELDLLLEAIFRRYGHDFRHYARSSLKRRVNQAMKKAGCSSISEMTERILYAPSFFQDIIAQFSITVTEMFRDPKVYLSIRNDVVPYLKTYPFIKIWHAGCATGEEVYSLAILLIEEGICNKCTIYATDFNDSALDTARHGIYSISDIKQWSTNYHQSGGTHSLSEYFHAEYDSISLLKTLRDNITFANHNLAVDEVFGEMHMVLCRNVLIYFDQNMQNRALRLFTESLTRDGFLCIGTKESLRFSEVENKYDAFQPKLKIFRKKAA